VVAGWRRKGRSSRWNCRKTKRPRRHARWVAESRAAAAQEQKNNANRTTGQGKPDAELDRPPAPLGAACPGRTGRGRLRLHRTGTTTVRFWAMGREAEVVSELIHEFEAENPGIKVDVQNIPWTAAHEKLLTAFAADGLPDAPARQHLDARVRHAGRADPLQPFVQRSPWWTRRTISRASGIPT
jgi:hypothetical protein